MFLGQPRRTGHAHIGATDAENLDFVVKLFQGHPSEMLNACELTKALGCRNALLDWPTTVTPSDIDASAEAWSA